MFDIPNGGVFIQTVIFLLTQFIIHSRETGVEEYEKKQASNASIWIIGIAIMALVMGALIIYYLHLF